ncbi:MAG: hypothetical protein AAB225_14680 [Acidobacteriota bacterium]
MEDEKAVQFFEEVLNKTRQHRIRWEPTASDSEFVAPVGGQFTLTLRLSTGASWEGIVRPELVLKDSANREILSVNEKTGLVSPTDLDSVYELARRDALRVDEKVDEVLGQLSKL